MRRNQAKANRAYAMATAAVLVGVLALSTTVWAMRPAEIEAETLCPSSRAISGHTLVIVDRTDRWSPSVGAALKGVVERAQRDTAQHAKFSVVSLDKSQSVQPVFSVCNPGAPTIMSDLYRGRRFTERDFEERFIGASDAVIDKVSAPASASTSPIVEYLHRWLGGDDFNQSVPNRRVILISDMRQNSPLYNIYKQRGDGLGEILAKKFGPAAEGVTFDIYYVDNAGEKLVQEDTVRGAWEQAFNDVGAKSTWRQIN
jgi:hypothetical protein